MRNPVRKWWRRKTYKPPVAEIAIQVLCEKRGWLDLIRMNTVDMGLFAKWGGYGNEGMEEQFAKGAVIRYTIKYVAEGRDYEYYGKDAGD